MLRPRVVFAGTPEFAVPSLRACLTTDVDVVAVYTQPDRPAGRGRKLSASPIKQLALENGLAIEQPASLRDAGAHERLRRHAPDLLVVVAYGLILPQSILDIPTIDCWNVHASLLPRWRGAAPIQRAIMAGDAETGVALMRMQARLDSGPILLELREPIAADDTGGSLHDRLAERGAEALAMGLRAVTAGNPLAPIAQSETGVTYARKLDKSEARLDWNLDAAELARKVRAFDPWPVAEAAIGGDYLRIWSAVAVTETYAHDPGTVVGASSDGIDAATAKGILRVTEVQRAGGRRMHVRDYLNARPNLRSPA